MTDERIDIEITDKVSPQPAKKLREIASEALKADSALDRLRASLTTLDATAVDRLASASAKLTNAQAREVSATARLENARAKMTVATARAAIEEQRLATEAARTEAATQRAAVATSQAAAAAARAESASLRLAAAKAREQAATTAATGATKASTAAYRANAASARLTGHQTQNLVYQVNDVVVGLASGQAPLTVLLQQGSQISTVFGPGTGVTGIMRGLGQAIFSIARMFAPVLVVAAAVGAVFAGLTYEIGKTTDVAVGMGDVFRATFQLIGEAVYEFIQPAIAFIAPYVTATWNFIIQATKTLVNGIVGSFVFAKDAIVIAWNGIPAAIGSVVISAVNLTIGFIEDMVNKAIELINSLIREANKIGELVGVQITEIGSASIGRLENVYAGAGEALGSAIADAANNAFSRDYAGDAFTAIRERSIRLARERIAAEEEEANKTRGGNAELSRKQELLNEILKPLTEYRTDISALNELLAEGAISIGQYNQALSSLSLVSSLRDLDASLTGTPFADAAALEEVQIAEQERLNIVQQALEARIISEQDAADRIVEINRQAAADIQQLEVDRNSMILTNAQDTFASLAQAAKGFAGEQSGIYKALFITSKAFAIADSIIKIQQGIANAMSLPFPANLAAAASVAAAAASIVSNIQAVQFADGGKVTGPGGPRDDKILARVSNGEYVVNAAATRRNLPLLEALNSGRDQVRYTPAYADGGQVQPAFRSEAVPRVGNTPQVNVTNSPNIRIYTRDPDTRVEYTPTQQDAATARRVSRGQRNL